MNELKARKAEIDADLQRMTQRWRQEYEKEYTAASRHVLDSLLDLLNRGGKRLRGSLAMESYYLHGGRDARVALGVARVVELLQVYLLIMDDIQDRSRTRRSGRTLHVQLAANHDDHYGVAQAINASLLASHHAFTELLDLAVPDTVRVGALQSLNQNMTTTINGQINDLYNQTAIDITEEAIVATMTWKTAYYTFLGPMELGARMAGAAKLSDHLRNYALNAGVAFQIHDDIAGVFGDSKQLGKSMNDDIREGKATLLVGHARVHAQPSQQKTLLKTIGNSSATVEDCDEVRYILENTGSKQYAYEQAKKYAVDARAYANEHHILLAVLKNY